MSNSKVNHCLYSSTIHHCLSTDWSLGKMKAFESTFLSLPSTRNNHELSKVSTTVKNELSRRANIHYIMIIAARRQHADSVLSAHVSRWNGVWSYGRIDVTGDDELQRQINAAFYYILSSLPPLATQSDHKQFYGLSPGSLSRGGLLGEDYGGHSFWDTVTWMFPSVLLFYPT